MKPAGSGPQENQEMAMARFASPNVRAACQHRIAWHTYSGTGRLQRIMSSDTSAMLRSAVILLISPQALMLIM